PRSLLRSVHHERGRGRLHLVLDLQARRRRTERPARRVRRPGPGLAVGLPAGAAVGDRRRRLAGHRLPDGDLPGRPARHPEGLVRVGCDRRGEQGPAAVPDHHPTDDAEHLLRADHAVHHLVPGVRRDLHHDLGRAGPQHQRLHLLPVPGRVLVRPVRLCRRDGVGAVRDPRHHHLPAVAAAEEVGVLRMSTTRRTGTGRRRRTPISKRTLDIALYLLMIIGAVAFALPLIWMIGASLKEEGKVLSTPPTLFPTDPQWGNYGQVLGVIPQFFWNSVKLAVINVVGVLAVSALAGFAFGRLRFPGRNVLFIGLLATAMIPGIAYLIPQYIIFQEIGWVD